LLLPVRIFISASKPRAEPASPKAADDPQGANRPPDPRIPQGRKARGI
jgi:hypothetical protein